MAKLDNATALKEQAPAPLSPFEALCVVNRRAVPVEFMFNSVPIYFKPHQKRFLQPNVAFSIVPRSALQLSLASGVAHSYALGIEGVPEYPTEPLEGPLATTNPLEALDRRDTEQLRHSEPKALTASGEVALGVGLKQDESPVNGIPAAPAGVDLKPQALSFHNAEQRKGHYAGETTLHGGGSRTISKGSS